MLQLAGPAALSAFRIAKLLERLRALEPTITGVAARFMHFIDLSAPLTAREQGILAQLLTYGPRLPLEPEEGEPLLVVPRAGTISPWSSKATDIAQVCGLAAVRRIERGIAYRLRAPSELGAERLQRSAAVLIDRMTEENDTSAPLEDIIVMLCDRLIPERSIDVRDPNGSFSWRQGNVQFAVHDGVQERH